jgi:hypothetical protein
MNQSTRFVIPNSYLVGVWTCDEKTKLLGQLSEWDLLLDVIFTIFEYFARPLIKKGFFSPNIDVAVSAFGEKEFVVIVHLDICGVRLMGQRKFPLQLKV